MTDKSLVLRPRGDEERAVTTYYDRRGQLIPTVHDMCNVFGCPLPPKNSKVERMMIELAPYWLEQQKKTVKQMIDATLLPPLAKHTHDANVPREELWREKVRHHANNAGGTVGSGVGGFFLGLFLAFVELLVLAMERLAIIIVPGVLAFILYCLVSLMSQPGQWTREMIGAVLLPGMVVGALMSLLSATLFALYRAWVRQKEREQVATTEKWGSEPENETPRQLQFGGVVNRGDGDGV